MEERKINKPIGHFKPQEKLKLRENLNSFREKCVRSNELLFELFLKPNADIIDAIDRFLLNGSYKLRREQQIGSQQLIKIIDSAREQQAKVWNEFNINLKELNQK
jgi:hypothetical protein